MKSHSVTFIVFDSTALALKVRSEQVYIQYTETGHKYA